MTDTETTRWIGPVPTIILKKEDWEQEVFYHPGGPAPKWGGYKPRRTGDWGNFCDLAVKGETLKLWDDQWVAHVAPTRLRFTPEGWYIEAPAERVSMRCVYIAEGALRDGVSKQELLKLGISQEEIELGEKELA